MSIHDDYARTAMAELLRKAELELDGKMPGNALGASDRRLVERVAVASQEIAREMIRESCSWHGHDYEAVVDVHDRQAWWRCRRCGESAGDGVEAHESLESHAERAGIASLSPGREDENGASAEKAAPVGKPLTRWLLAMFRGGCDLTSTTRLVLLALSTADADDPSLTDLEQVTGFGRSTITRALAELESGGWVRRDRQPPLPTKYEIVLDRIRERGRGEPNP